ncbi:hypothetical protein GGI07_002606 [Coemansia sp. Benny D115]|nr:hypothetical protein GGI07_002606 [Coemansia sp. Benny D115]
MKIFATLILAASAAVAQQVGSSADSRTSTGSSAVSHPNENNGWQAQNTLFNTGNSGGNVFSNLHGNTFNSGVSNTAVTGNNFVNPSQSDVSGNTGPTANGRDNHIGDVLSEGQRFIHGAVPVADFYGGFRKRSVVFNNFAHGAEFHHGGYPVAGYPLQGYPAVGEYPIQGYGRRAETDRRRIFTSPEFAFF